MNWVGGSRTRVSVGDRNQKNFKGCRRLKINEFRTPLPNQSSRMSDRKQSLSLIGNVAKNGKSGKLPASTPKTGVDVFNLLLANISTENLPNSSEGITLYSSAGSEDRRFASATRKRREPSIIEDYKYGDLTKTPLPKRNGLELFRSGPEKEQTVTIPRFETPFTLANKVASLYSGDRGKNSSDDSSDKSSPKLNQMASRKSTPYPRVSTKVATGSAVRNNWDCDKKTAEYEDGELSDDSRDVPKLVNQDDDTGPRSRVSLEKHVNDLSESEGFSRWDKDAFGDIPSGGLYHVEESLDDHPEINWNTNEALNGNSSSKKLSSVDFLAATPQNVKRTIDPAVRSPNFLMTPIPNRTVRSEIKSVPVGFVKTAEDNQDIIPHFGGSCLNEEDGMSKTRREVIDMVHEMVDRIGARRVYKMLTPIHAEIML